MACSTMPGRRCRHDHQVRAAAFGQRLRHPGYDIRSARIRGFERAEPAGQLAARRRWCRWPPPSRPSGSRSIVNISPIGPWPRISHHVAGLRVAAAPPL